MSSEGSCDSGPNPRIIVQFRLDQFLVNFFEDTRLFSPFDV